MPYQDQIRHALQLASAGEPEKAREILRQIPPAARESADFWAACAVAAISREQAIGFLERALKIDPDHAGAAQHLRRLKQDQSPAPADTPSSPPSGWASRRGLALAGGLVGLALLAVVAAAAILWQMGVLLPAAPPGTATPAASPLPTRAGVVSPSPERDALTPSQAATSGPTVTPSPTPTPTPTHTPTFTPTGTLPPSETPTPSATLEPTATETPSATPSPTEEPVPTLEPDVQAELPPDLPQPTAGPCDCYAEDLDCSDFGSQGAAQACYDYCYELEDRDVHRLDDNLDGVVCESLP